MIDVRGRPPDEPIPERDCAVPGLADVRTTNRRRVSRPGVIS